MAAEYLVAKGYRIIVQRWRDPVGGRGTTDVDMVAVSPDGVCHFVEVKTRTRAEGCDFSPEAAVTAAKSRRMAQAAERYMAVMGLEGEIAVDLVAVTLSDSGAEPAIGYYPDIAR